MSKFKSNTKQVIDKNALIFGLISVFLCGMGFSIITPVVPFLVEPYIKSAGNQAMVITLLTSVYALCMFFVAPGLGALSDKYGRRPILLICLFGSTIGYLFLGIGGALWVLFIGRIIDGITGGNISTIFAYFSDITPIEERTKYFGWISAVAGLGAIIGPTLGGMLTKFGYAMPMYFGAIITLLNFIYGFFFMPESLHNNNKLEKITFTRLNPFEQLANILSMKNLRRLLISAFLLWIPSGALQAVLSKFTIDAFSWKPVIIGLVFSIMGLQDIISQGFVMPKLLKKLTDVQIVIIGMSSELIGYTLIAASALFTLYPIFIAGMFVFGFGDSIFGPSFNGLLSKSVDSSQQGRIQGGSQSIQSLARIIGPIIGGQVYVIAGHAAPAIMGSLLMAGAIAILYKNISLR